MDRFILDSWKSTQYSRAVDWYADSKKVCLIFDMAP
jgi:hypothetical protein